MVMHNHLKCNRRYITTEKTIRQA
uniref:Uncharacterized protein n=1 Tax=Arundo donax TaxID=35708 RepID=A0A0A9F1N0_ARUDO